MSKFFNSNQIQIRNLSRIAPISFNNPEITEANLTIDQIRTIDQIKTTDQTHRYTDGNDTITPMTMPTSSTPDTVITGTVVPSVISLPHVLDLVNILNNYKNTCSVFSKLIEKKAHKLFSKKLTLEDKKMSLTSYITTIEEISSKFSEDSKDFTKEKKLREEAYKELCKTVKYMSCTPEFKLLKFCCSNEYIKNKLNPTVSSINENQIQDLSVYSKHFIKRLEEIVKNIVAEEPALKSYAKDILKDLGKQSFLQATGLNKITDIITSPWGKLVLLVGTVTGAYVVGDQFPLFNNKDDRVKDLEDQNDALEQMFAVLKNNQSNSTGNSNSTANTNISNGFLAEIAELRAELAKASTENQNLQQALDSFKNNQTNLNNSTGNNAIINNTSLAQISVLQAELASASAQILNQTNVISNQTNIINNLNAEALATNAAVRSVATGTAYLFYSFRDGLGNAPSGLCPTDSAALQGKIGGLADQYNANVTNIAVNSSIFTFTNLMDQSMAGVISVNEDCVH